MVSGGIYSWFLIQQLHFISPEIGRAFDHVCETENQLTNIIK